MVSRAELQSGKHHPCERCGQPTPLRQRFCSRSCVAQHYHPRPQEKACAWCKDGRASGKRKYCSVACYHAASRWLRTCKGCGCVYLPTTELEPGFCSLRCAHGKPMKERSAAFSQIACDGDELGSGLSSSRRRGARDARLTLEREIDHKMQKQVAPQPLARPGAVTFQTVSLKGGEHGAVVERPAQR